MNGHLAGGTFVADLLACIAILIAAALGYGVLLGLYNVLLHPLRDFPGPLLWRAYRWPWALSILRARIPFDALEMHNKYGPVVRIAPDELSYTDSNALKAIYGHHNPATEGYSEFAKDPIKYPKNGSGAPNILVGEQDDHSRFRRLLSHAFSDKGLKEMQPRIQGTVDKFIDVLKDASEDECVNMEEVFKWTTFDMIGDLAFGESFQCLDKKQTHPWIAAIFGGIQAAAFILVLGHYGLLGLVPYLTPKRLIDLRMQNLKFTKDRISKRIEAGPDRGDFWDKIIEKSDFEKGTGMSSIEMVSNASILVLAGSETTATLLAGTTFFLLKNPDVLRKLNNEVRTAFETESEIDLVSVSGLDYMLAVLDEALRVYPPVPNQGGRLVPQPGAMIAGKWIPGGTAVSVQQYASDRSASNFHRPDEFCPERWFSDPPAEFGGDDHAARAPFSMGPRNCIGRNLAYAEMRLVLVRLCFNFDLELDEKRSGDWMKQQKASVLWEKPPLWVRLKAVRR